MPTKPQIKIQDCPQLRQQLEQLSEQTSQFILAQWSLKLLPISWNGSVLIIKAMQQCRESSLAAGKCPGARRSPSRIPGSSPGKEL